MVPCLFGIQLMRNVQDNSSCNIIPNIISTTNPINYFDAEFADEEDMTSE